MPDTIIKCAYMVRDDLKCSKYCEKHEEFRIVSLFL